MKKIKEKTITEINIEGKWPSNSGNWQFVSSCSRCCCFAPFCSRSDRFWLTLCVRCVHFVQHAKEGSLMNLSVCICKSRPIHAVLCCLETQKRLRRLSQRGHKCTNISFLLPSRLLFWSDIFFHRFQSFLSHTHTHIQYMHWFKYSFKIHNSWRKSKACLD